MRPVQVFIVADSRGRRLKAELDKYFTDTEYRIYWKSGLKLTETYDYVAPIIRNIKPKIILLINGICDLTYVRTREPWTVALRQPDVDHTVYNYMSAMDLAHSQIFSLSDDLGYKPMILFSTVTGIDMTKYNNYPEDLVSPEQRILDRAVLVINRNIIRLHKSMSLYPPILASAVHMRCRKRYRMAKSKLVDGCHPTTELANTWARRIYRNVTLNLEEFDRYTLMNQMY